MSEEAKPRRQSMLGLRIGNVRIKSRIGKGGVGVVYKAEHEVMGTPYAVKVLNSKFSRNKTIAERFRREAIACGRLHHPNVVFITDFGYKDGVGIYIIMEFLKGETLEDRMAREGQMDIGRAGQIALQICDAMEAAHSLDIVHRDLKPANIHLCSVIGRNDLVKILDFGIARVKGETNLTATGTVVGSPHYMAPEQVQGFSELIGPGSDIYALGVVLYQMISGIWPIWDHDIFKLCTKQVTLIPELLSTHRPELEGTQLEDLVARMLAKKVAERPTSMAEVAAALEEALDELGAIGKAGASITLVDEEDNKTRTDALVPNQIRMIHLVQALRAKASGSALVGMLDDATEMVSLPEDVFRTAAWGAVATELLDAPLDSHHLNAALNQCAALVDSALHERATPRDQAFVRGVGVLLGRLDKTRQDLLIKTLQPLSTNPLFPTGMIPTWATVQTSGTWKNPLMPSQYDLDDSLVFGEDLDIEVDDDPSGDKSSSLFDKLNRPVSIQTMKRVLTHNISLSTKKADEDEGE